MTIRETKKVVVGGVGRNEEIVLTRVRKISGSRVPEGAVRVPNTTPKHDWKENK